MTRGYLLRDSGGEHEVKALADWERYAVEAVGSFIEFWGFKRNQGRIWTFLYLRGEPMSAGDLQEALDLSKGAVSMNARELERWGVVHRVRVQGSAAWHFVAETDLLEMIGRVLMEREGDMVARIREDLAEAKVLALRDEEATEEQLLRLQRINALARLVGESIGSFLETGKVDLFTLAGILRDVQELQGEDKDKRKKKKDKD